MRDGVLSGSMLPLFSFDLRDLALSFNLDRPVVNAKNYQRFVDRVRQGKSEYLIISDRALRAQPGDPGMRRIARGLVTRQPFTVLHPAGCRGPASWPDDRRSG
jgi:hypothetical protein